MMSFHTFTQNKQFLPKSYFFLYTKSEEKKPSAKGNVKRVLLKYIITILLKIKYHLQETKLKKK